MQLWFNLKSPLLFLVPCLRRSAQSQFGHMWQTQNLTAETGRLLLLERTKAQMIETIADAIHKGTAADGIRGDVPHDVEARMPWRQHRTPALPTSCFPPTPRSWGASRPGSPTFAANDIGAPDFGRGLVSRPLEVMRAKSSGGVLLDCELADISGFDVLRALPED
jgi:hypothetical protein